MKLLWYWDKDLHIFNVLTVTHMDNKPRGSVSTMDYATVLGF